MVGWKLTLVTGKLDCLKNSL